MHCFDHKNRKQREPSDLPLLQCPSHLWLFPNVLIILPQLQRNKQKSNERNGLERSTTTNKNYGKPEPIFKLGIEMFRTKNLQDLEKLALYTIAGEVTKDDENFYIKSRFMLCFFNCCFYIFAFHSINLMITAKQTKFIYHQQV